MEEKEFFKIGILRYHNSRVVITEFEDKIWHLLNDIFNSYIQEKYGQYQDKLGIKNGTFSTQSAFPKEDFNYSAILNWKDIRSIDSESAYNSWAIGIQWKEQKAQLFTGQWWNPYLPKPKKILNLNYGMDDNSKGAWIITKEYTPELFSRDSLEKEFFSLMDEYLELLLTIPLTKP